MKEQWAQLDHRRVSFQGCFDGLDKAATANLLRDLPGLERHRLRCILTGALPLQTRLFKAGLTTTANCQCCGQGVPETEEHVFLHCPAHDHIRGQEIQPTWFSALPHCLALHGLLPSAWLQIPGFDNDKDRRRDLAARVQYTLLDIWRHRLVLCPLPEQPLPRWLPATALP